MTTKSAQELAEFLSHEYRCVPFGDGEGWYLVGEDGREVASGYPHAIRMIIAALDRCAELEAENARLREDSRMLDELDELMEVRDSGNGTEFSIRFHAWLDPEAELTLRFAVGKWREREAIEREECHDE